MEQDSDSLCGLTDSSLNMSRIDASGNGLGSIVTYPMESRVNDEDYTTMETHTRYVVCLDPTKDISRGSRPILSFCFS